MTRFPQREFTILNIELPLKLNQFEMSYIDL